MLQECCGPLSKHNKYFVNLGKSVEKQLCGVSSSSANTEGTISITENLTKLLKPPKKEGILGEEPWFLGVRSESVVVGGGG